MLALTSAMGEAEEQSPALQAQLTETFTRTSNGHPQLAAYAFLVFTLTYTPCVVVVSVQRQEYGARWMCGSVLSANY